MLNFHKININLQIISTIFNIETQGSHNVISGEWSFKWFFPLYFSIFW